jgi:hypothetical protein
MSTQVQRRKGTTAQHASFTGASAELTVDTTKNTVVVHDGSTAGGFALAKETGSALSATSLSLPNSTTNGVAYVNSSKVLTTGTVLTFNGSLLSAGNISTLGSVQFSANTSQAAGSLSRNATYGLTYFGITGSSYDGTFLTNAGSVAFGYNSSGNLGLGVTPSAWFSIYKALQIGSYGASIAGQTNDQALSLWSNAYPNASNVDTYVASSSATKYRTENGTHKWYNAPSGTAGNAITFTQAMTLDASGNLLLGTTSGSGRLNVQGNTTLSNADTTATSGLSTLRTTGATTGNFRELVFGVDNTAGYTWQRSFQQGVGNTAHAWFNYNTQAMTLDASGNLWVGTTAALSTERVSIVTGGTQALYTKNNAADFNFNCWNAATTGDNQFIQFITETAATARGSITYNRAGGLVAYNVTSDYRAKDISGPVVNSGSLIDSVPVYMGKMKGATQERPMFIAHETPNYAHTGVKDAVDENGKPVYQQMDASALIPVMWAEIQDLRKRLAAAGI